ncbi:hypothetical protein ACWEAF_46300, partial [Streptomyces sp. NPDC005071]
MEFSSGSVPGSVTLDGRLDTCRAISDRKQLTSVATSPDVIETDDDEISTSAPAVLDPARLGELAACAAVFLPADPPRLGRVAFWRTDGGAPPAVTGRLTVVRPHGV